MHHDRITAEQRAAAAALCAKRGDVEPECLSGAAREMYLSMSAEELQALAVGRRNSHQPQQS